jgi:glyoxylase-like metal-dependent hydrolase (beta-lactamase superfamily II)
MMKNLQESRLKSNSSVGSGQVRCFEVSDGQAKITQITTFCPDLIGPGATNLYLIQTDALVLLDTGLPTSFAKAFFYNWRNQPMPTDVEQLSPNHSEQEFHDAMKLAGYRISDIDAIVISHGHPDHFLMASVALKGSKAALAAHILDTPQICNPWGLFNTWFSRQDQMKATGMPSAWTSRSSVSEEMLLGLDLDAMGLGVRVTSPVFANGPLKVNGSAIRGVEVEHLPGHTPGSIGLTVAAGDRKVLMCGDVLLNPISPHPDDLLVYLRTLDELAGRDDVGLVLPAHGQDITELRQRARILGDHHEKRLRLTYEACAEPRSVWDIATMDGYFDTYVDPDKFNLMAGTEALVHVELLNMVDGVRRTGIQEAVHYFHNTGEPFDEVYGRIDELVRDKTSVSIMRY